MKKYEHIILLVWTFACLFLQVLYTFLNNIEAGLLAVVIVLSITGYAYYIVGLLLIYLIEKVQGLREKKRT